MTNKLLAAEAPDGGYAGGNGGSAKIGDVTADSTDGMATMNPLMKCECRTSALHAVV